MDAEKNKWKQTVGFPINYSSENSDDDFDFRDVVMRHPRPARRSDAVAMLADEGDGADADQLGTTPPRERIRNKRKGIMDRSLQNRLAIREQPTPERASRRLSHKTRRSAARDAKLAVELAEPRADSLPSPAPHPAAPPTLVESCSRFMSLSSRLKKCRGGRGAGDEGGAARDEAGDEPPDERGEEFPPSRVSFHQTFSMLINMGNIDKGCRRMISREEQVWQNELKDLIWLELQAKIAGRTLAEQDAFLCAQRRFVPAVVNNIRNYRFVNTVGCRAARAHRADSNDEPDDDDESECCLSLSCAACAGAVGKALRELGTLLDSYHHALALYPSSHAMTADHPLIATRLFKNRLKAMCLWYNTAMHMRLKVIAVRRMIRTMKLKGARRALAHLASTDSDASRQSFDSPRACTVRFDMSTCADTPSSSDNSHDSQHSQLSQHSQHSHESRGAPPEEQSGPPEDEDETDSGQQTGGEGTDEPATPEIVISDDTGASSESGYTSSAGDSEADDVFALGDLSDITELRLLHRAPVSIYRSYHQEALKTVGVRRCMSFINKMRCNLLHKVYLTLDKPQDEQSPAREEHVRGGAAVFDDNHDDAREHDDDDTHDHDDDYELRRFGCWSAECLSMRLPSYRAPFLLLSCVCLEATHDYLALRLETRPVQPSCLTIKQLIHELKEGLDIGSEMRADFARNVEAALAGQRVSRRDRRDLLLVVSTFDDTVETVLKQYLSYLRTMSAVEQMSRACLQAEWAFTARLATRVRCAAQLAPTTFSEIACNQLDRVRKQFKQKFEQLDEFGKNAGDPDKHFVYSICRAVQNVYASERDATLHAAHWARCLAARLARQPALTPQRAAIFNSLMGIRELLSAQTCVVLERSRGSEQLDERSDSEALGARVRELMMQIYRLGFEVHKELHQFVHAPARRGRRGSGGATRPRLQRALSVADDGEAGVFDDNIIDYINNFTENQTSIELLLREENRCTMPESEARNMAAMEAHALEEEKRWAAAVARAIVQFARCWMTFVIERCEKGRGVRPRWACQGLEFLMLACDPRNTRHLSEAEFEALTRAMDACISHVIGQRPPAAPADPAPNDHAARPRPPRIHSPLPQSRGCARPASPAPPSPPAPSSPPSPPALPSPPLGSEPLFHFPGVDTAAHSARVVLATRRVDRAREQRLAAARALGRVLHAPVHTYEPKLRQLTFKWQRGLKIGAGSFGKVYTVVNTETGQLLAMKEISLGVGDRKALQRAANELRVLEGVIHPHLVRYYGCELHREEMLLFMELCVEGSLEALVATAGALQEHMVRRYAKQLVAAVAELHARNIAHRDIKSGNIFLTNEGHCLKLGDFGCAVKIRANTTAAGELMGHVGTQAYMAPEVFMKPTGHGRAADIWSVGCVVTEMAGGKRPFAEYDSNVQIMFVVGMGGRPAIPPALSAEGAAFCSAALTHEPDQRPRATELLQHSFLMLKTDDDCECEPSFLRT